MSIFIFLAKKKNLLISIMLKVAEILPISIRIADDIIICSAKMICPNSKHMRTC